MVVYHLKLSSTLLQLLELWLKLTIHTPRKTENAFSILKKLLSMLWTGKILMFENNSFDENDTLKQLCWISNPKRKIWNSWCPYFLTTEALKPDIFSVWTWLP